MPKGSGHASKINSGFLKINCRDIGADLSMHFEPSYDSGIAGNMR